MNLETIALCGCRGTEGFTCVSCKKVHRVGSTYSLRPVYFCTYVPKFGMRFGMSPIPVYPTDEPVYRKNRRCFLFGEKSEYSAWCPKRVSDTENVRVCGSCKLNSIRVLYHFKNIDTCLQTLLELNYKK